MIGFWSGPPPRAVGGLLAFRFGGEKGGWICLKANPARPLGGSVVFIYPRGRYLPVFSFNLPANCAVFISLSLSLASSLTSTVFFYLGTLVGLVTHAHTSWT